MGSTVVDNLDNRLSGLGRREEALAATAEAVDIYASRIDKNPAISSSVGTPSFQDLLVKD